MKNIYKLTIYFVSLFLLESIFLNFFGIRYSGFLFILLGFPFFLIFKIEYKFLYILFSLPFAAILKLSDGQPSFIFLLMLIFIYAVLKDQKFKIRKGDVIGLLLLVIMQVSTILTYNSSYLSIFSFMVNITFLFFAFSYFYRKNISLNLGNCTFVFTTSVLLSIFVVILFPRLPYIILYEKASILASVNRFAGINGDPNYYNQLVIIAISMQMICFLNNFKISRIFNLILILVLTYLGLWSRSKSFVITLSIILAVFIILFVRKIIITKGLNTKSIIKIILFVLLSCIGIFLFISFVTIPLIESRTDVADISTGRFEIWNNYIKMLLKEPYILITGVGFGNGEVYISKYVHKITAAHNVLLELSVDLGLISIFIIMLIIKKYTRKILDNSENILILVAILISSLGLSLSSNDVVYIILPISIVATKKMKIVKESYET